MKPRTQVYAGIVTYNPDIERLKTNLDVVTSQTNLTVICDNGSNNQEEVISLAKNYPSVLLIKNNANMGIAAALNQLMNIGKARNLVWMLTLDQDSVCTDDFIEHLFAYTSKISKVGIVAPTIVDRNIGNIGHKSNDEYELVRTCISSGSMVRVSAWSEIGGYDAQMFIDSVDFDFCYRLRQIGYRILLVRSVCLLHELGKSSIHSFFGIKIQVNGHSSFRKYYISRNNIYYPLKNHLYLLMIRGNIRNIALIIKTVMFEDNKTAKVRACVRGWYDGLRRKV